MLAIALAFNLFVFLLACIGMMVVFVGGEGYLPVLLILLILATPVSLLTAIAGFGWFVKRAGFGGAAAAAWRTIPQWLAVTFWLGITLVFCGELALLIAARLADKPPGLWQHLPLLAGLVSAAAFCLLDAVRRRRETGQAVNGPA
ncbi:MAG TPA: hypothetical protein VF267_05560 [Gammaproteobacteria bacterium]